MEKSMYSLILMDEVVQAVDRLAYESGTSRSNLVNRILAEYVSLVTPEKRIQQIFNSATAVALGQGGPLQLMGRPTGSMLSLKSVVHYKYNPVIRYNVEVFAAEGTYSAEFRVASRSQSDSLLDYLTGFFLLWAQVEQEAVKDHLPREALQHEVGGGRFCRRLAVLEDGEMRDTQTLGEVIGAYIRLFDQAMNLYFDHSGAQEVSGQVEELYQKFLDSCEIVI